MLYLLLLPPPLVPSLIITATMEDGYSVLPNNRSTTDQGSVGFVSGAIKAAFASYGHIRPTRKRHVIGNLRPNGNVSTTMPLPPAYNPADRAQLQLKH